MAGKIFCFGSNANGQLGQDSAVNYGDLPGSMTTLNPIAFNPLLIPPSTPLCAAKILTIAETSGQLAAVFSPLKTFYVFAVPAEIEAFAIISAGTFPSTATVSINDGYFFAPVPLPVLGLSQVQA
jgi:hypothetical protein